MSRALSSSTVLRSGISGAKVRSCWWLAYKVQQAGAAASPPLWHTALLSRCARPQPIFPSVIVQLQDAADDED